MWLLACTGRGVLFEHWAAYFNAPLNKDFVQDAGEANSELLFFNGAVQQKCQFMTRYFDRLMDVKYAWYRHIGLFKTPAKLILSFYFLTGLFSKNISLWHVILTDWWM